MTVFHKLDLTHDEEMCIMHFLTSARDCGYPSGNEPWYDTIDSIYSKFLQEKYKKWEEPQEWQTV